MRHPLVRAVASRNRLALLARNTRFATGNAAHATIEAGKPAEKLSQAENSERPEMHLKAERIKQTVQESLKATNEAGPVLPNSDKGTKEGTAKMNSSMARLPLEPGEAAQLPARDGEKVISERILRLVDEIASLTIFEVADLNSTLKKKLNIPDMPIFAQGFPTSAAASSEGSEVKEEKQSTSQKTFFSVKLVKIDDTKKIPLIKEIRATIEGFNLVQAKKFVEALPATVKEDLSKNEAEELKAKLENMGAVCEIV